MNLKAVYTLDVVEHIINSMISSGSIDSITNNGDGTWTISCSDTGNLKDCFKIKIGSNYYRISNLSENKSFKVTTANDLILEIEWEMYINYYCGSLKEFANYIQNIPKIKDYKEKFDAIWLMNDIKEENLNEVGSNVLKIAEIIMAVVTNSDRNLKTSERLTSKFKTRLEPLFNLFQEKLIKSKLICYDLKEGLDIESHNRFIYGSDDEKNVLNEITDAIELKTTVKIKKQYINEC